MFKRNPTYFRFDLAPRMYIRRKMAGIEMRNNIIIQYRLLRLRTSIP